MTPEALKVLLAAAIAPISRRLDEIETGASGNLHASAVTREMVEPHAAALDACRAAMEAAGIGTHPSMGHVHVLRRMSDSMRAEAAMGKVPSAWRDHDYPTYASATGKGDIAAQVARAVHAAVAPLQDELKSTTDKIAAAQIKLKDLNEKRITVPPAERGTLSPLVASLLEGVDQTKLSLRRPN